MVHNTCASAQPELIRLAKTIDTRWPQIAAFIATGISNAGSEGTNRVIKLEVRNAYGFRNPANQRLRVMTASTRRDAAPSPLNFEDPI